jgi:hypothetical protein
VPVADDLLDRDLAMLQDRGRGMTKTQLGEKYGLERHAVATALDAPERPHLSGTAPRSSTSRSRSWTRAWPCSRR